MLFPLPSGSFCTSRAHPAAEHPAVNAWILPEHAGPLLLPGEIPCRAPSVPVSVYQALLKTVLKKLKGPTDQGLMVSAITSLLFWFLRCRAVNDSGILGAWHRAGTQLLQDQHSFAFCFQLELNGFCYLNGHYESDSVSFFLSLFRKLWSRDR